MGQCARFTRSNVAKQVGDDALGQVIGFDGIGNCQLLQGRNQPPMSADHTFDHASVPQVVEPTVGAIALTRRVHQRQVARSATTGFGLRIQEPLLERHGDGFGKPNSDKSAGGHRVAIMDEAHRFGGTHHLVAGRPVRCAVFEMGVHQRFRSGRQSVDATGVAQPRLPVGG